MTSKARTYDKSGKKEKKKSKSIKPKTKKKTKKKQDFGTGDGKVSYNLYTKNIR